MKIIGMALDTFFQTPKPKETERCSNPKCRKILGVKEPKYTITIKDKTTTFCRECAREHLPKPKPQKPMEEEAHLTETTVQNESK